MPPTLTFLMIIGPHPKLTLNSQALQKFLLRPLAVIHLFIKYLLSTISGTGLGAGDKAVSRQ